MGADIHMFVETKQKLNYDEPEKWVNSDHFKLNPHYDEDNVEEMEEYGERKWERIEIEGRRNYNKFSALADVRNDGWITPISKPRGLPEDVSAYVQSESDYDADDGHSHSWVTLTELKEWAKENKSKQVTGWLNKYMLEDMDKNGEPGMWYKEKILPNLVERTFEVKLDYLDELIEGLEQRKEEVFSLRRHGHPDEAWLEHDEKIRIVFWFDN